MRRILHVPAIEVILRLRWEWKVNVLISSSSLHAGLRQRIDTGAEFIQAAIQALKNLGCSRLTHGVRLCLHSINISRSRRQHGVRNQSWGCSRHDTNSGRIGQHNLRSIAHCSRLRVDECRRQTTRVRGSLRNSLTSSDIARNPAHVVRTLRFQTCNSLIRPGLQRLSSLPCKSLVFLEMANPLDCLIKAINNTLMITIPGIEFYIMIRLSSEIHKPVIHR